MIHSFLILPIYPISSCPCSSISTSPFQPQASLHHHPRHGVDPGRRCPQGKARCVLEAVGFRSSPRHRTFPHQQMPAQKDQPDLRHRHQDQGKWGIGVVGGCLCDLLVSMFAGGIICQDCLCRKKRLSSLLRVHLLTLTLPVVDVSCHGRSVSKTLMSPDIDVSSPIHRRYLKLTLCH